MEFDLTPLWISLKTAVTATGFAFILGMGAARWMMGKRGNWKTAIEAIFIAPLVLPPTVLGFLLLLFFGKHGPGGKLLEQFDITVIFSWSATAIAATVVAFPLMYKTALAAFEQIDRNLLNAARTLGAAEWRIFWQVMLPLSWPGIVAGTILAFARALGEFGATLMLAGNIPGETQTIPVAIYFAVEAGEMREAQIWVAIVLVISLSAIAAVNFSQNQLERLREGRGKNRDRFINFSPSRTYGRLHSTTFQVDIENQLKSFELGVNFAGQNGEPIALLGASGSGKSMTLRCIAGLETPTRGRIELNGRVLFDSARGINLPSCDRRIGVVFQNYALFPHLNVEQNIGFGLKHLPKGQRDRIVAEKIAQMDLQGLEKRHSDRLSGGQQQRVALARALAISPDALLLDEPFSALDTYLRHKLEKQLRETLATYEGATLFVTHNIEEAYRISTKLLILADGAIAAYGAKQDMLERPPSYIAAQLTGCKNFSRARAIGGQQVEAIDWGCTLSAIEPLPESLAYVGYRAHQFRFPPVGDRENSFPCWLAQTSETPHRMTLYLKLQTAPHHANDYHLQAEVFKEKWEILKDRPFPWYVRFDPLRLIVMER